MSSLTSCSRLAALLAFVCVSGATQAWASPTLIFAQVAEEDDTQSTEASVQQELSLALDEVILEVRALEAPGFGRMPLAEQLPLLDPWTREDDVLAVTWLDPLSSGMLRLHVVFASEGRAVLRVVEADPSAGGAPALALALREVLDLVLASREAAATKPEPPPESAPVRPGPVGDLHLLGGVGVPKPGAEGPPVLGSLQAGVTLRLVGRLSMGVEGLLLLSRGPSSSLHLTSVGGGLRVHWLPGNERVGAGPVFSVLLLGTRLDLQDGDELSVEHFDVRVSPGIALRLEPLPQLAVFVQAALDFLPRPWEARRRSDGGLVFFSADLGARFGVGVTLGLPGPKARPAGRDE